MTEQKREGPFEQIGEAVGGTVGRVVGRVNDAALDAAGSMLGAAMQAMGAWWSSPDAERASQSFGEQEDRACREHFESGARKEPAAARDYESVRPAYQFGYVAGSNPRYQGKRFDEIEAELETTWESAGRERWGGWPQVRDQVGFGYTRRTPGAPNPS